MKQKTNKQTTDFIPIIDYTDDGVFITKSGYLDFVQITCKDLNSANDYDTHFRWDTYQDVYMIWHHIPFYDFYTFPFTQIFNDFSYIFS